MVLAMSRPFKNPKTGIYYFRKAVPEDLRAELGKWEVKVSLGTKDPAEAKLKHAAMAARVEDEWRTRRAKPEPLTHKEVQALAGSEYLSITGDFGDDPGDSDSLEDEHAILNSTDEDDVESFFGHRADAILLSKGIKTDAESRRALLAALRAAYLKANARLQRNAEGDYSPDTEAAKYPTWNPRLKTEAASLPTLLRDWWSEAEKTGRKPSTLEAATTAVTKLIEFLGHDDAARVTKSDIIGFKDRRLAEGISAKTIKTSNLSALKVIFDWAVANERLAQNPVIGVKLKVPKRVQLREKGFTDDEAKALLRAALNTTRTEREGPKRALARRWVPWLQAYSGTRVGELLQLRKQDVVCEHGIWVMRLTPDAGPVKTGLFRKVPLHPHMVEMGFPEFAASAPDDYLFLTPSPDDGDVRGPIASGENRLRDFVRTIVTDERVDPTHGWRHRFKTTARLVGIEMVYVDAIQGHAPRTEGEKYGDMPVQALAREIAKQPRFETD